MRPEPGLLGPHHRHRVGGDWRRRRWGRILRDSFPKHPFAALSFLTALRLNLALPGSSLPALPRLRLLNFLTSPGFLLDAFGSGGAISTLHGWRRHLATAAGGK